MPPPDLRRIKEIFSEAAEKSGPERQAFLHRTCGNNSELLAEVEAFLSASENAGDFLTTAKLDLSDRRLAEGSGTIIGPYKLLELIGEGGFGSVFLAKQERPVRRQVALKIIKLGMDTRQVIARFEAERQALAMMDHPNIARVYEAGATDTGRPYFVMEWVRGIPITDYCDNETLTIRQHLELFIQVCQAIQHAHQKGIIHRDVKPSNVLVMMHDEKAVPKLIDFGIAKAVRGRLTDKTLFTEVRQFVGTLAYMSPEQAQMNELDVDTRSDVYSLGVLLYELLTGATPFDTKELRSAVYEDIRRIIREVEPPKPSTRINNLGGMQANIAQRRRVEPGKLAHAMGELDWIVMKCLEKDRARRYETANALALDLQRHLNNEPVSARPPSSVYRFSKLVRRNQLAFFAGVLMASSLLGGLGVSTWMFLREMQARREAVAVEQLERQLRQTAEANEQTARREAEKSGRIAQFLEDMLTGAGPTIALGRDTTILREILDKTAVHVGTELNNQPDVEADLQFTMGRVYYEISDHPKAEIMFRKSLDLMQGANANPARIAEVHEKLATLLSEEGRHAEAEPMARQALAEEISLHGNDNLNVASAMDCLAREAEEQGKLEEQEYLYREAMQIREKILGGDDPSVAQSLNNLGFVLERQGKLSEAESVERRALAIQIHGLGKEHPDVATSLDNLGHVLSNQGKLQEAEQSFQEAFTTRRKVLGDEHAYTAGSLGNLVGVLVAEGKTSSAEQIFHEILTPSFEAKPGSKSIVRDRGTFFAEIGRFDKASEDFTLAASRTPDEWYVWIQLASLLAERGDLAGYRKTCNAMLTQFGDNKDQVHADWIVYACLLLPVTGKELDAAVSLADSAAARDTQAHLWVGSAVREAGSMNQFVKGLTEYRHGRFAGAAECAQKALDIDGLAIPEQATAYSILAMAQYQMNQTAQARTSWHKASDIVETQFPKLDCGLLYWHFHAPLNARIFLEQAKVLLDTSSTPAQPLSSLPPIHALSTAPSVISGPRH